MNDEVPRRVVAIKRLFRWRGAVDAEHRRARASDVVPARIGGVRLTDADTPAPGRWAWRIGWSAGVVHTPALALKREFAFVGAAPYETAGRQVIRVTVTDAAGASSAPPTAVARRSFGAGRVA